MYGGRVRRALDADDLDSAWALLEECLTKGFGEEATQPRARITLKEAHPNTTFEGDAFTVEHPRKELRGGADPVQDEGRPGPGLG